MAASSSMKIFKTVTKEVQELEKKVCNGCGHEAEYMHSFSAQGGYDSLYPYDLETVSFELCDPCLAGVTRKFMNSPSSHNGIHGDDGASLISTILRDFQIVEDLAPDRSQPNFELLTKMRASPLFAGESLELGSVTAYVLGWRVTHAEAEAAGIPIRAVVWGHRFVEATPENRVKIGNLEHRRWYGEIPDSAGESDEE